MGDTQSIQEKDEEKQLKEKSQYISYFGKFL